MGSAPDGSYGPPLRPVEAALTLVLAPMAGAAWLALLTAELGRLSPIVALSGALVLLVGGAAWLYGGSPRGPVPAATRGSATASRSLDTGTDRALGWLTVVLALLAVWRVQPAATPWPAYLDASWYVNTAARVVRSGGLSFTAPLLAADAPANPILVSTLADGRQAGQRLPPDDSRGFHAVVFAVDDVGRAKAGPYHPPLFTSWIALWMRLFGVPAAGAAVLPWSLAYLLAVGALASAAFGTAAGTLAVALVGVGPAFAYYGPTPYAETAAGALALAGLWLLTRLALSPPRPRLAAAAGLALGLAGLAKVDVAPVAAVAAVWWLACRRGEGGRKEGVGLVAGLALPVLHAAVLAVTTSRFYFALNGWGIAWLALGHRRAVLATSSAAGLLLAGAVVHRLLQLRRLRRLRRQGELPPSGARAPASLRGGRPGNGTRVLRTAAATVVILGLAALSVAEALRQVQASPPGMFDILSWMATPLGLWSAVAGLFLVLDRPQRSHGPLIAAVLLMAPLTLAAPLVTQTLSPLYAGRRLVPIVLPAQAVLAAGVAAWALGRGGVRVGVGHRSVAERAMPWPVSGSWWGRALALAAGAGVGLVMLVAALEARPILAWRDFSGGETIARRLAAYGEAGDVLLFPSTLAGSNAGRMAAAVWGLQDRPTAVLARPIVDAETLSSVVTNWRSAGRSTYYVTDEPDRLPVASGYELRMMGEESLVTYGLAPVPELPVRSSTVDMRFVVFEFVPPESAP